MNRECPRLAARLLLESCNGHVQARLRLLGWLAYLGFACGGALLSWVVAAGATGLAPVSGGMSLIVTKVSAAAGIAAGAQCFMAGVRMYNEYTDPQDNVIRMKNPGISEKEVKLLLSRNVLPKPNPRWITNTQIREAIRTDLLDAVDAVMDVASSSSNGLMNQATQTPGKVGDYLFGLVNAYEAM
jgi:hypothetical protein